jgi:hypothetical protein
MISPDLTAQTDRNAAVLMGVRMDSPGIAARNDGISNYPALVTIAESPAQAGVYFTGSEDGVVSMSRDNGRTWTNVTSRIPGFPAGSYVSEVVPSRFNAATVYVTVDTHRENDMKPYIWMSTDAGQTFRSITGNLVGENARTLREDLKNPNVLYIGTAVFVGNILILTNLLIVTFRLLKAVKDKNETESVAKSIVSFLPIYILWIIVVIFIFPVIFGFK